MKGANLMEKVEIKVLLRKNESNRDVLIFKCRSADKIIDLNSDNQEQLQDLFYDLIKTALKQDIFFSLDKEGYEDILFSEISEEYLKKLESEISEIRESAPDELKEVE